jgi:spore coat protein U-like protein
MKRSLLLTLFVLFFTPGLAEAATCTVSATGLAFGAWSFSSLRSAGTVSVTCDTATSYTIILSTGNSGTYSMRNMTSGTNTMSYNLYADAAYTEIWGDGSAGTITLSGSTSGNVTIYGLVPNQTSPAPGIYTDNIVITISY